MSRRKPLFFVTGLPRSGSSWTAAAITAALQGLLIYEPYNAEFHPERRAFEMRYLPAGADDAPFLSIFKRELSTPWRPRRMLKAMRTKAIILKDVHAGLATEYIWEQFRPNIVIIIRNPFAFAASWQRVNFNTNQRVDLLLNQPRLIADHLAPFVDHMHASSDSFYRLGVFWGASYFVMQRIAATHPEWVWVTHESLCADPDAGFANLLTHFGLQQTARGRAFLQSHNRPLRPDETAFSVSRVAADQPDKWRDELTPDQVEAIRSGCVPFELLEAFYPDLVT